MGNNQPYSQQDKGFFLMFVVMGILLWGFTIYKALNASFTHDEFTLLSYAERSYYGIFIIDPPYAGCHIFLTFLAKPIITLFGASEFTLRLPTLIAHLIYLIFTYRLVVLLHQNRWVRICTWLLLNANPYLLDFYSIGRGYGLAIAMMTVSCYYFLRFVKEEGKSSKYLFGAFFAGFLAVYTNFTLLNYYVALLGTWGLYVLYHVWQSKKFVLPELLQKHWSVPTVTLIMAAIIYTPLKRLVETDQFYFAGINGFWQDTVRSLARSYIYGMPYGGDIEIITSIIFAVFFFTSLLILLVHWCKQRGRNVDWAFTAMLLIFSLAMLSTVVQFHLIDTKYLFERIALFYIPLFFLSFSFALQYAFRSAFFKKIGILVVSVLSIFVVYHTIRACNTTTYRDWYYDRDSKAMMEYLRDEVAPTIEEGERVNVGLKWIFVPSFYFYEKKWKTENQINLVNKIDPRMELTPDLNLHYVYVEESDLETLKKDFEWEEVFRNWSSGGILLKVKKRVDELEVEN
ncbi:MAG: hypothetical protein R3E32_06515 [Chitinophagales bacterium]